MNLLEIKSVIYHPSPENKIIMLSHKNQGTNYTKKNSSLSEKQQFNEVCILLQKDVVAALKLANSKLKTKKYFENLLEKGLESANASQIEIWLRYLIPRLGFRYVIHVLEKKIESQPEQVKKSLYWLPKFLQNGHKKEVELFKNLEKKVMLESENKTQVPLGKTYKLILKNKRPRRKQRGIVTLFLTFHAPQGAGNLPVILLKTRTSMQFLEDIS
jgi:hypothetical protein